MTRTLTGGISSSASRSSTAFRNACCFGLATLRHEAILGSLASRAAPSDMVMFYVTVSGAAKTETFDGRVGDMSMMVWVPVIKAYGKSHNTG
jgi:hypothetical protein